MLCNSGRGVLQLPAGELHIPVQDVLGDKMLRDSSKTLGELHEFLPAPASSAALVAGGMLPTDIPGFQQDGKLYMGLQRPAHVQCLFPADTVAGLRLATKAGSSPRTKPKHGAR